MAETYYFGQGRVAIAELDRYRNPGKLRFLGNAPDVKLSFNIERIDHYEAQSGFRRRDRYRVKQITGELSVTLEEVPKDNLALLFGGPVLTREAAYVTGEVLPYGLGAGDTVALRYPKLNLFTVVVKDNRGNTIPTINYDVDHFFGTITFKNVVGYEQPFKVDYRYDVIGGPLVPDQALIPMMSSLNKEYLFRFHGVNLGDLQVSVNGRPTTEKCILVELYRVALDPVQSFSFINDEFAKFELKGAILGDETKAVDPSLGQYGRIIYGYYPYA